MMRTITLYQRLKKNLIRSSKVRCYMDWTAVHRDYSIDYRTIKRVEDTLQVLVNVGKLKLENSYNRGGRNGRDIRNARTIKSYRTANDAFAFKFVRYHRASGSHLKIIGDLGKWHMFFEANLRCHDLSILQTQVVLANL